MRYSTTKNRRHKGSSSIVVVLFLLIVLLIPIILFAVNSKNSLDNRSRASTDEKQIVLQVLNPEDDAHEDGDINGRVTVGERQLRLGWYQKAIGLRFQSIELATLKNVSVSEAYLTVKSSFPSSVAVKANIFAEKTNDCLKFEPISNNISGRQLTTNKTNWDLTNENWNNSTTGYNSPDLRDVINEVTHQPSWAGNNICLIIKQYSVPNYQDRGFFTKESGNAPTLTIKYTVNPTPTATIRISPNPTNNPTPSGTNPTPTSVSYACNSCAAIYGCQRVAFQSTTASCQDRIPNTVVRTLDCSCPRRNGTGGGNDLYCNQCPSPTPAPITTPTPTPPPLPSWTKVSLKKGLGLPIIPYCYDTFSGTNNAATRQTCMNNLAYKSRSLGATWYYGWYTDGNYKAKRGPNFDLEYVPMIRGNGQNADGSYSFDEINWYKTLAKNNPGSYWLIFNEPDYYNQDNISPEIQARRYKQLRTEIKSPTGDPTAKFIVGGFFDYANWRGWAEAFRAAYRAQNNGVNPVYEGWHAHIYTCGNVYNPDQWRWYITTFRNWINSNGGGELWLTEFGCLDYDYSRIITDQLDWMENYDGIQRYAWFAAISKELGSTFGGGDLFVGKPENSNFGLSALGDIYARYPLVPKPR